MAQMTITIPDAMVNRVVNAFASSYGWNPQMGISKAMFAREQIRNHIRQVVINSEADTVVVTARVAAIAAAETETVAIGVT